MLVKNIALNSLRIGLLQNDVPNKSKEPSVKKVVEQTIASFGVLVKKVFEQTIARQ